MSIKGFHIVFVTVTTLLCLFIALWSQFLVSEKSMTTEVLKMIGIGGAILMPIYGIYFYRKITRARI